MNSAVLTSCTPWAICLVVAVVAARLLVGLSGAQLNVARIRKIHTNQSGSVQSLSFVLTLPFFCDGVDVDRSGQPDHVW